MDKKKHDEGLSIPESLKIVNEHILTNSAFENALSTSTFASLAALNKTHLDIMESVKPLNQAIGNIYFKSNNISEVCESLFNTNPKWREAFYNTINMQNEVFRNASVFSQSKDIESLTKGLTQSNYFKALEKYTQVFDEKIILGQNLAFLKMSNMLGEAIHGNLGAGIPSIIKTMNIGTAHGLSKAPGIQFDKESKTYFDESAPENSASPDATNIIFSGLDLLSELSAEELFEFFRYIKEYPFLATNHSVGVKILGIIGNWESCIGFDKDYYYHARARNKEAIPYTDSDMCCAPNGLTLEGRYNLSGQSHYYFSDKESGAVNETKKHCSKEMAIQVAKMKPNCQIKILDLSSEKKGNRFLEYCRYQTDSAKVDHLRSEYLIPSYVANCCKLSNIDGIKYYGSSEYNNYVTWKDHYFDIISHKLDVK